jgi:hypothetical protein
MKKPSLDKTWELCLKMWKWITVERRKGNRACTAILKSEWCKRHSFMHIAVDCFFCEYNRAHQGIGCSKCPATLIDKEFRCVGSSYDYGRFPLAFYKKLLQLNRKRKALSKTK